MLENNITIIQGNRASGRTTFLLEIMSTLLSLKKNVLFLDILGGSEYFSIMNKSDRLYYHRFNSPRISNNMMSIDIIREKIKGLNIDYLFIDDLEFNEIPLIKKLLSITNCKIVLTSSEISDINKVLIEKTFFGFFKKNLDYKIYTVTSKYDDGSLYYKLRMFSDDIELSVEEVKSVILSKFREDKIDRILE